jgi:SRSO17 transposase
MISLKFLHFKGGLKDTQTEQVNKNLINNLYWLFDTKTFERKTRHDLALRRKYFGTLEIRGPIQAHRSHTP